MIRLAIAAVALLGLPPAGARADDLTINETLGTATCVVYELPEAEGRAEAVRFVRSFRDHFFRGAELVDALDLEEAALREKLGAGFVLFTTLHEGSRLLEATSQPLGMRIEEGQLHLHDRQFAARDLRLIFVGQSPYSDARVAVYAGSSNALLVDINNRFHGPRSLYVFRDDEPLWGGSYDGEFRFPRASLSLAEAVADAHQLFEDLERIHPDLLAKVSAREYLALRREVVDELGSRLDAEGRLSVEDLAYVLYRAAAFFQDGHTSIHWRPSLDATVAEGRRFPPFLVEFRGGAFHLTASRPEGLEGLEVVTIDGVGFGELIRPALARCSGEILPFRASRFVNRQAFWWWFTGIFDEVDEFVLTQRDERGQLIHIDLQPVSLEEFQELRPVSGGRRPSGGTRIEYLDGGRIGHFVYPTFLRSAEEMERIDRLFEELRDRGVEELILDIRGNGGGSSSMGEHIFQYLHEGPFRSFSTIRVRLSPDLLERSEYWRQYADLEGLVVTEALDEVRRERPEAFFEGRVTLLVDNGTFSSAADFATMFRDYQAGEIIGFETGGLATSFGDVFELTLAHSRIPVGVSHKQFFGPRPRPGDDRHGILPDVPMTGELLRPFAQEEDPLLAFAVERIRRRGD